MPSKICWAAGAKAELPAAEATPALPAEASGAVLDAWAPPSLESLFCLEAASSADPPETTRWLPRAVDAADRLEDRPGRAPILPGMHQPAAAQPWTRFGPARVRGLQLLPIGSIRRSNCRPRTLTDRLEDRYGRASILPWMHRTAAQPWRQFGPVRVRGWQLLPIEIDPPAELAAICDEKRSDGANRVCTLHNGRSRIARCDSPAGRWERLQSQTA